MRRSTAWSLLTAILFGFGVGIGINGLDLLCDHPEGRHVQIRGALQLAIGIGTIAFTWYWRHRTPKATPPAS